jgi:DNA-binding MarR family transcriptional regulator
MPESKEEIEIPIGTKTLILSKLYYGVLSKSLEKLDTERYFAILHYIQNNNGCCCQQNICNSLYIDKTAMVKILDSLTKAGFIERKVNPKDRRQHYISLSKKGEKQTKEITKTFNIIDKQMFSHISEKDKHTFKHVLAQLTENLKEIPKNNLLFDYKKTKE